MENRSAEGYVIRMDVEDTPINEDGSIDYNFAVCERREDLLEMGWDAEDIAYVRVTIEEIAHA
jgi:hypothetical protein